MVQLPSYLEAGKAVKLGMSSVSPEPGFRVNVSPQFGKLRSGCRVEARPATAVPLPALCPAQSRYPGSGGVRGVVETEELILTIFGEDTVLNGCLNKTSVLA